MKNKLMYIIAIILLSIVCFNVVGSVYAVDEPLQPSIEDTGGEKIDAVTISAGRIYKTIAIVVQVAAVIGIIIVGLKYMYSGSDQKSEIKKSMIYIIIGCVLVFSAGTVISIIGRIVSETL
mgnify:FL=1